MFPQDFVTKTVINAKFKVEFAVAITFKFENSADYETEKVPLIIYA